MHCEDQSNKTRQGKTKNKQAKQEQSANMQYIHKHATGLGLINRYQKCESDKNEKGTSAKWLMIPMVLYGSSIINQQI